MTPAATIADARSGNRAAFAHLVRTLYPHVERQLQRYRLSDADRHDVIQSTLLQVITRLRTFRGDANFTTWLFRVTANEALMALRVQRQRRLRLTSLDEIEEDDDGEGTPAPCNRMLDVLDSVPTPEAALVAADVEAGRGAALKEAMCVLSTRERELIHSLYWEQDGNETNNADVARKVGRSRAIVWRVHRRALDKMRAWRGGLRRWM